MFQVDPSWRSIEDVLTGDFFGALDYLPRIPYLVDALQNIQAHNPSSAPIPTEGVEWDNIEFEFWPMTYGEDEAAEPDVLIVSNRWLLVVEVKLHSGLGRRQPWREFVVGQEIASSRGLPPDAVYYIVVSPERLDVGATFAADEIEQRQLLLTKTHQIRWSDLVAMIEQWLRRAANHDPLPPEQARLLNDLLDAMRKRRRLAFAGFGFENQPEVAKPLSHVFVPQAFEGFLGTSSSSTDREQVVIFLESFQGFLDLTHQVTASSTLHLSRFGRFDQLAAEPCSSQPTFLFDG